MLPRWLSEESRRFDLWAAGVGCCSPGQTNFHCDDVAKPHALSALRLEDSLTRSGDFDEDPMEINGNRSEIR